MNTNFVVCVISSYLSQDEEVARQILERDSKKAGMLAQHFFLKKFAN